MKSKSYISLDEIIKSLLIQMGEQTEHKYMQLLDIGMRGSKELAFDATQEVKVAKVTIDSTLSGNLPCDFIGYRRVGLNLPGNLDSGVLDIHSLGKNPEMSITEDVTVGCPATVSRTVSNAIESLGNTYWIPNYRGGENVGGVYGMGGENNSHGYYRIDKEKNQRYLESI